MIFVLFCPTSFSMIISRYIHVAANGIILSLSVQFSLITQSVVSDSATLWNVVRQAYLSITNSRSLLKHMSIMSVMPSNHLILCSPLLFLPSVFPSIRVFSSESVLCIRWPQYWIFSFSTSPFNEYSGLISFRTSFTAFYFS